MELSKQERELFLLFLDLGSKNFFEKIFTLFTKESNPILLKFFKQELKLLLIFPDLFYYWKPKELDLDNA